MPHRILTLTPNAALDLWTATPDVEPGPKLRCTAPVVEPGGGGINVSRALVRLRAETLALYAAGGPAGTRLAKALEADGVPALAAATADETRQSLTVQESQTGQVYRFVLPGPTVRAEEGAALLALLRERAGPGDLVVGSGSLPPGLGEGYWAEAATVSQEAGARFLLDSAHGVAPALAAGLFCLRLNHREADALAGRTLAWPGQTADWAADTVATHKAGAVIVARGSEGAVLATAEGRVCVRPAPNIVPISAIGAGDSFVAGLCCGLAQGQALPQAMRLASATAAATLLSPGTALCQKADVDRLLDLTGQPESV